MKILDTKKLFPARKIERTLPVFNNESKQWELHDDTDSLVMKETRSRSLNGVFWSDPMIERYEKTLEIYLEHKEDLKVSEEVESLLAQEV